MTENNELKGIDDVLREFQAQLRELGLLEPDNADNVRVLMKATGLPETVVDEKDFSQSEQFSTRLGLSVEILDVAGEAGLLYKSALRNRRIPAAQPVLVADIGESATFLLAGKGAIPDTLSQSNPGSLPTVLPLGWGTLLLEQPTSPDDVQMAQSDVMAQLTEFFPENPPLEASLPAEEESPPEEAPAFWAFVGMNPVFQTLARMEQFRSSNRSSEEGSEADNILDAPDGVSGCVNEAAPDSDRLHRKQIEAYLNAEGLAWLETAYQTLSVSGLAERSDLSLLPESSDEPPFVQSISDNVANDEIPPLEAVVGTLIILHALAERLEIDCFQFGAGGGLDAALLDELTRTQVINRNTAFGQILHERYDRSYRQAQSVLETLFPDFRDALEGRVKDPASITHKLNSRAFALGGDALPLHTLEDAAHRITDGHGFVFVLNDVSTERIRQMRDAILRAIQSGRMEILAIKNYRGADPDTPPYFQDADLDRIRKVMERRRMKSPPVMRSPRPVVLDGADALKPSGYTATQLRIRLRNPDTGAFDLPEVDLHICGEKVYRFYRGADHLVYDIRQGKDIYQGNPALRVHFEPEVKPLLEAIESMSDTLFERFSDYRGQIYAYLRQLEMGRMPGMPPRLPDDLPDICHLVHLTRLGQLQRRLIERFSQPVAL